MYYDARRHDVSVNEGSKQATLHCHTATLALQYSHSCKATKPLLHSESRTISMQKRLYW